MDKSIQIDTFSRFTQVSRETIISLNKYEDLLIKANENLNCGADCKQYINGINICGHTT